MLGKIITIIVGLIVVFDWTMGVSQFDGDVKITTFKEYLWCLAKASFYAGEIILLGWLILKYFVLV